LTTTQAEVASRETGVIVQGQEETILLVDDDENMRSTIAEVLDSLGYTVLVANDGAEALEIFKAYVNIINLVLTDMVMPKMDGADLAKSIRQLRQNIPIIFATGYDKAEVLASLNQFDHSNIIGKPFVLKELAELIQKLIQFN